MPGPVSRLASALEPNREEDEERIRAPDWTRKSGARGGFPLSPMMGDVPQAGGSNDGRISVSPLRVNSLPTENGHLLAEDRTIDTSAEQPRGTLRRWLPWLTKGSLAIADQGVFAVSNFLLNILLARWLTPDDYGCFALAYSVFLSFLLVHSALFTTPLLVFGQGKYRERFPEYLGILLRGHLAFDASGFGAAPGGGISCSERCTRRSWRGAFVALAAAAPFILLLWLLRRAFYALLRPCMGGGQRHGCSSSCVAATAMLHAAALLSPPRAC